MAKINIAKFISQIQDLASSTWRYHLEGYERMFIEGQTFVIDMKCTPGGLTARVHLIESNYDPATWDRQTPIVETKRLLTEFEISSVWADSDVLLGLPKSEYMQVCSMFYDLTHNLKPV